MCLELRKKAVAGLLSVSEQHRGVWVEENWVIHSCVSNTQRSLHDYDLQKKPTKIRNGTLLILGTSAERPIACQLGIFNFQIN